MTTPMSAKEFCRQWRYHLRPEGGSKEFIVAFAEQIRQAEAAAEQRGYRRGLGAAMGVATRSCGCFDDIRALAKDSEAA